jgi:hypothetical protein
MGQRPWQRCCGQGICQDGERVCVDLGDGEIKITREIKIKRKCAPVTFATVRRGLLFSP